VRLLLRLAILLACGAPSACAHAPALHDVLARAASAPDGQGRVAVSVLDLSTGARTSVHGDARMPMMSVFKVGLAVVALDQVDHGQLRLDQPVPIAQSELEEDDTPTATAWKNGDHAPKLETLLSWMIQDSDNVAADRIFALLGGAEAITSRLHALGVDGMQIAEPEIAIAARLACPGVPVPAGGWTASAIDACPKPTPEQETAAAVHELEASRNDASTDALVDLLARLDRGALLGPEWSRWLVRTMEGTRTGPGRLKGMLPPGTVVAHKTGTARVGGVTVAMNDVGIVTMPGGHRFAIAVMLSGSRANPGPQEDVIARLARGVWDALRR
jgi:beta-lactamase class A